MEGADVSNAYIYIYRYIDWKVIMERQMNSSEKVARPRFVCKLNKSLIGLWQAGKIWGDCTHNNFLKWAFTLFTNDQGLHFSVDQASLNSLVLVLDDMPFSSDDRILGDWFKKTLKKHLNWKV